jgi:hypothetical protein
MSDVAVTSAGAWPAAAELARVLTNRGMPNAAAALATMNARGEGPPVTKWGGSLLMNLDRRSTGALSRLKQSRVQRVVHHESACTSRRGVSEAEGLRASSAADQTMLET